MSNCKLVLCVLLYTPHNLEYQNTTILLVEVGIKGWMVSRLRRCLVLALTAYCVQYTLHINTQ